MEGGVATASGAQSGAGTADTHLEAGTTSWSGEDQQVGMHTDQTGVEILSVLILLTLMCVCNLRVQHEVSLLQQQLCESRELIHSLQSELQVYDRVCSSTKANKGPYVH